MKLHLPKRNSKHTVILVLIMALLWIFVGRRISRMDHRFFQPSISGVEGLILYMAGNNRGAAEAYRAHFHELYKTDTFSDVRDPDEPLKGDLLTAKESSNKALAIDPTAIGPLLTLGEIALEEHNLDEALGFFKRILNKDADQFDALLLSSLVYAESGENGKAISSIKKALATSRTETRMSSFLKALKTAGELGDLPQAKRPLCLLAYYYRYFRIFDPSNGATAISYAKAEISAGDRADEAYITLGVIYKKEQKNEKALKFFLKTIETNPQNADAYSWAGKTYSDRGDLANEYSMKKMAYDIEPENSFIVSDYNYLLAEKLGDYQQALVLGKKAMEAHPENAILVSRVGYLYSYLGNPEQAVTYYEKAVSMAPESPSNNEGLGLVLAGLGRREEARTAFLATLSIDPHRPRAYIGLAHIFFENGQDRDAIKEFEKAFMEGEKDLGQLSTLCGIYFKVSEYTESADCFRKVLLVDPENQAALHFLSSALTNIRKKEQK